VTERHPTIIAAANPPIRHSENVTRRFTAAAPLLMIPPFVSAKSSESTQPIMQYILWTFQPSSWVPSFEQLGKFIDKQVSPV
jgi:hypothetical protein